MTKAAGRGARRGRQTEAIPQVTVKDRTRAGKALRDKVPRTAQAKWETWTGRRDAVEQIRAATRGLLAELLPIRYVRMRASPFAFFRGSAAMMAGDLAHTPVTGLRVQACGDCHLANFGGFGSPERRLLFDINDFDETLPAPWEWDVKRFAASVVLAGRERGLRERECGEAAKLGAQSYRTHMRRYARMRAIEVWYSHLNASVLIRRAHSAAGKKRWETAENKAKRQTAEHVLPSITEVVRGRRRIVDRPPMVYHPRQTQKYEREVRDIFRGYRLTLPEERRVILDRYRVADVARKVVGVGSVGTRCDVMLLMAGLDDPLLLQFKEARESVLEPYAGKSRYRNHGERAVTGQRLLQAASDVFLGWTRDDHGRDYYFRQLRDMKMSVELGALSKDDWTEYVAICAWTLARAHARTGDPAQIAGYLGKSDRFDEAIAEFAVAYADQTERDYEVFVKGIRAGRLHAASSSRA